jgi:hypothetical protein
VDPHEADGSGEAHKRQGGCENPAVTEKQDQHLADVLQQLYEDALEIYERARTEVTIERSDGTRQRYAPVRYKQEIERGHDDGTLVPTIARILRRPTLGFSHLEEAERPDLMLETLVLDQAKPYHHLFSPKTVELARARMAEYAKRHAGS